MGLLFFLFYIYCTRDMNLYNINQILPLYSPTKIPAKYKTESLHLCAGTAVCIKLDTILLSSPPKWKAEYRHKHLCLWHSRPLFLCGYSYKSLQNSGCLQVQGDKGDNCQQQRQGFSIKCKRLHWNWGLSITWQSHHDISWHLRRQKQPGMICMAAMSSHWRFQSLNFYNHLWLYHLSSVKYTFMWDRENTVSFLLVYHDIWIIPFVSLLTLLPIIKLQPQSKGCPQRKFM